MAYIPRKQDHGRSLAQISRVQKNRLEINRVNPVFLREGMRAYKGGLPGGILVGCFDRIKRLRGLNRSSHLFANHFE